MSVERETYSTSAQFLLLDSVTSSSSVHIHVLMTLFCIKSWQIHLYMLTPLYSQWNNPTSFSPQGAIHKEYWNISWAKSTKYVSKCKYQIKEQCSTCYVAVLTYISALVRFLCKILPHHHNTHPPKPIQQTNFHYVFL
jgi:hypothetical protein